MSRQWTRTDLIAQLRSEIVGYFGAASEFDERVAKRFKLSRTDMRCLEILGRLGPMTAGQLAEESGLSTGAVTFLLDRLEEAGMVTRRRDTDDRRRIWVELVPAAHKKLQRVQQPIVEEMRAVSQRFKAEELAIVRDFMREAKEVFQRQVATTLKGEVAAALKGEVAAALKGEVAAALKGAKRPDTGPNMGPDRATDTEEEGGGGPVG